jgi:glutamine amidotransferase
MCRHIAWLGADRSLADLVLARPSGLLQQSWAPRRQRHGRVNADGFGVGWYAPGSRPEPARYRRAVPIWTDASFASFAGVVASGCVLAAVRSASVGMPIEESATAPFTHGPLLLSHNGRVSADVLLPLLSARPDAPAPDSRCDSALLAALVWERANAGVTLAAAVAEVVTTAGAKATGARRVTTGDQPVPAGGPSVPPGEQEARLNLLVTDGRQLVATTWNESLWYRVSAAGVLVASEPDDDGPTVPFPRASADGPPARGRATPWASGADQANDEDARPYVTPGDTRPFLAPTDTRPFLAPRDTWVEVPNHHLLVADTRKVTVSNLISQDDYSGFIT